MFRICQQGAFSLKQNNVFFLEIFNDDFVNPWKLCPQILFQIYANNQERKYPFGHF